MGNDVMNDELTGVIFAVTDIIKLSVHDAQHIIHYAITEITGLEITET